ncbi:hypothetical protein B0H10DRAFT_1991608 [Mycena sp. CBHHK59/15]|nr:hypothetical protein B0H10DRAFT_1991608 [Mycena sp. CBHHK59/15]
MLRLAALSSRRSAFLPPLRAPLTPILFRSINIKLRTRPPNRDAGLTWCVLRTPGKQPGHRATNCPEPVSCHACGGTGHIARACPNPDPERIRTCRRCGSRDHFVQDCTQPRAWCVLPSCSLPRC